MLRAPSQERWVSDQVAGFPWPITRELRKRHAQRLGRPGGTSPVSVANTWLGSVTRELRDAHVAQAYDEHRLRCFAENGARMAKRLPDLGARLQHAALNYLKVDTARRTRAGLMLRLEDPKFWRRALRQVWTGKAESACRALGLVRKHVSPYVTQHGKTHYLVRADAMRRWIENHDLVNQHGEQLELFKAVDASVANPRLRRTELMVRMRGFEEIAAQLGHVGTFATLTAPSAFHAQGIHGDNPNFMGFTAREAQRWLCERWARARTKLKRLSVLIYGVRVVEAHHDGTPHWHLVLFTTEKDAPVLEQVLRQVWLKQYAHEAGAEHVRCQFARLDPAKGSAAGYLGKYIAKNIDGAGAIGDQADDESGESCRDAAVRIRAWASVNRIRQFQQIGGPPVTLWREVRRIDGEEPPKDRDIARAWRAACANSWHTFTLCCGGIRAGRKTNIKVHKECTGKLSKYLEPRPPQPVGVKCASALVITRADEWQLIPKRQRCSLLRQSLKGPSENSATWTRSNNCLAAQHGGQGETDQEPRAGPDQPPRLS